MPILYLASQYLLKSLASAIGQYLPVGKSVIGGTSHRCQVALPFRGAERSAYQLAIHQVDAKPSHRTLEFFNVIGAYLVTEAARTAMDLACQIALFQTHH